MHLAFKRKHEEFIVIRINLNIVKNNSEKHLYDKNDFYFESNNIGYDSII